MSKLIEIREKIRRFYSTNGRLIGAIAKLILMFISLFMISQTLNYTGILASPVIMLVIAIVMALLPSSVSLAVLILAIGLELYPGLEALAVYAAMILLFVAIYFIFKPGKSYCVTLSILLSAAQFFGPLPMMVGLIFSPVYCIGMGLGMIIGHFITYIGANASMLASADITFTNKILNIITDVYLDDMLWINLFIAAGVAIIIYIIRKRAIKHSWSIAIVSGCISSLLLTIIFTLVLDIDANYIVLVVNTILEALTGVVLMYLFFMVDYSREEILQFEDDEYVYYVKAIPKLSVTIQEMKVTRIREHNIKRITKDSEDVTFIKGSDEDEEHFLNDTNVSKSDDTLGDFDEIREKAKIKKKDFESDWETEEEDNV